MKAQHYSQMMLMVGLWFQSFQFAEISSGLVLHALTNSFQYLYRMQLPSIRVKG